MPHPIKRDEPRSARKGADHKDHEPEEVLVPHLNGEEEKSEEVQGAIPEAPETEEPIDVQVKEADQGENLQVLIDQQRQTIAALQVAMQEEKQNYARDRAEMESLCRDMKSSMARNANQLAETQHLLSEAQDEVQRLRDNITNAARPGKGCIADCDAPTYDGETEWFSFLVLFEAWLRINQFDETDPEEQKACCDMLGLSLTGNARTMFCSLPVEERSDYQSLKMKLQHRYSGESTVEVSKAKLLGMKKRQLGESITVLRDEVHLLAKKAYPTLSVVAQEQFAKDALLRALDHDLRIQCTIQKCKTLDEVVAFIESYEAVARTWQDDQKDSAVSPEDDGSKHHDAPGKAVAINKLVAAVERQTSEWGKAYPPSSQ